MKQLTALLLAAVLLALCACRKQTPERAPAPPDSTAEAAETSADPPGTPADAADAPAPDVTCPVYTLDATLTPDYSAGDKYPDLSLTETAKLEFTNTSQEAWERVCLRDYAAANLALYDAQTDGASTAVSAIRAVRDGGGKALDLAVQDDPSVVYVTLPAPLAPGARTALTVDFETPVPCGGERFGWFPVGDLEDDSRHTVCLSQAYPVLAEYRDGQWNEAPYFQDGECFSAPCGSFEMTLRLPAGYTVISTGEEQDNGDGTWTLRADNVRDFAVIAGTAFEMLSAETQGVTVRSFYAAGLPEDRAQGEISLQAALDAVDAFTDAYGAYPYGTLDVVEAVYNYGGMEYPGLVRISQSYASDLADSGDESLRLDVAHEVAHQWFYAVVGNDQYREAWLDESFAVYSELVYRAQLGAPDEELQTIVDGMDGGAARIDLPYDEFLDADGSPSAYVTAVYRTGAVFLWRLRQAMGADAFGALLRDWYQTHQFEEVTTAQFRAAVLAADGSDAVQALLDAYL